jgi:hypothetical protein
LGQIYRTRGRRHGGRLIQPAAPSGFAPGRRFIKKSI